MTQIDGSLALVTGASSGIGAATAKALAIQGAHVLLLARRESALQDVAAHINAKGGKATAYVVDVTDAGAVVKTAQEITDQHGTPDILINNAGFGKWRFVEEITPGEATDMMACPYFAAFNVTHAFLPAMMERGSGKIVCVNSPLGRFIWPGTTAYTAARWALRGFTYALRADLAGSGVSATHYVAGKVDSPYWQTNTASEERFPLIARLIPTITPDAAARGLLRAVRGDAREVVTPFLIKTVFWQHALVPYVVDWLMRVTGYRRPAMEHRSAYHQEEGQGAE